jgi:hypothetical protein
MSNVPISPEQRNEDLEGRSGLVTTLTDRERFAIGWEADRKTRDWLRDSIMANAPAWTSLPPGQLIVLLDLIDELEDNDAT